VPLRDGNDDQKQGVREFIRVKYRRCHGPVV
jgi:hypothetical protein